MNKKTLFLFSFSLILLTLYGIYTTDNIAINYVYGTESITSAGDVIREDRFKFSGKTLNRAKIILKDQNISFREKKSINSSTLKIDETEESKALSALINARIIMPPNGFKNYLGLNDQPKNKLHKKVLKEKRLSYKVIKIIEQKVPIKVRTVECNISQVTRCFIRLWSEDHRKRFSKQIQGILTEKLNIKSDNLNFTI